MAARYKIQVRGGMHVVLTVDSSDLNTVQGVRDFVPRGLSAVAEGGAVNLVEVSKDRKVFIGLAYDEILTSAGAAWGSTLTETVDNLNAFFLTSPHDLEDLDDVPVPVNARFLKYVDGSYVWAEADGTGAAELESALAVTNTIGDAIADTTTYAAGTTLETIIRDIIGPFLEPSVISAVASSTTENRTEGNKIVFPTGISPTITAYTITTTNFANLEAGLTITDVSAQPANIIILNNSSFSFTSNTTSVSGLNYQPPTLTSHGAARTVNFVVSYLTDGTGSTVTITKASKVEFRDHFYAIASSQATVTDVADLLDDDPVIDKSLAIQNVDEQTYKFDCTSDSVDTNNFTYLIISSIFDIDEIAASVSGRGVADYTDSFTELSGTFSYTVGSATRSYKIYKSNQTGAFDSDVTLNLTISKP
jgi:hypothetical protein